MRLTVARLQRWVYPLSLLVAAAIVAVAVYSDLLPPKELIAPVLSLFGTFFGATFAFRLNEDKEARKLNNSRREALNRALFVLVRQANAIRQIARDFERFPAPFERAFNLPALKPPPYQDLVHSLSDLDFLLESTNPGLLMELAIEQERFHQAFESLKVRNEFYIGEVQPALAKLALNGKSVSIEQTANLLGERLFGGAMNGAEFAWQHLSASNLSIPIVHKALLLQAKALFPRHKFITYDAAA